MDALFRREEWAEEVEREVCLMIAPESIIRAWYFLEDGVLLFVLGFVLLWAGVD